MPPVQKVWILQKATGFELVKVIYTLRKENLNGLKLNTLRKGNLNGLMPIPYICHFFYTGRIFENQILHPKKRLKAPKTLKMSLKKSNICIFFTQSGKIYTWQKIFTQAPPVVPVTNMRYVSLVNLEGDLCARFQLGEFLSSETFLLLNDQQKSWHRILSICVQSSTVQWQGTCPVGWGI